jgi:hypothetical protein
MMDQESGQPFSLKAVRWNACGATIRSLSNLRHKFHLIFHAAYPALPAHPIAIIMHIAQQTENINGSPQPAQPAVFVLTTARQAPWN